MLQHGVVQQLAGLGHLAVNEPGQVRRRVSAVTGAVQSEMKSGVNLYSFTFYIFSCFKKLDLQNLIMMIIRVNLYISLLTSCMLDFWFTFCFRILELRNTIMIMSVH